MNIIQANNPFANEVAATWNSRRLSFCRIYWEDYEGVANTLWFLHNLVLRVAYGNDNIIENACLQSVLFQYKCKFARIIHSAALLRKITTLYVLANYI